MGSGDRGLACLLDEISNLYSPFTTPDPQFILVLLYLAHCSEVRHPILLCYAPDIGFVGP